jgi:hypothetical protein
MRKILIEILTICVAAAISQHFTFARAADLKINIVQSNMPRPQTISRELKVGDTSQSIVGIWEGSLDAGSVKLRLLLKVTQSSDGLLAGTLDSVDQRKKICLCKLGYAKRSVNQI